MVAMFRIWGLATEYAASARSLYSSFTTGDLAISANLARAPILRPFSSFLM